MAQPMALDEAKKPGGFQPTPKHGPGKTILPPPPVLPLSSEKQKEYEKSLLKALDKQFGFSLETDEGLELSALNMDAINEKAEKYDCLHPHAYGCWELLNRSLDNSFQAMEGTTPEKVDEGIKSWSALEEKLATPEFLAVQRTIDGAINDWVAAHPEDAPEHKQKAAAGLTNPEFDKAVSQPYSSEFARIQSLTYVIAQEMAVEAEKHMGDQAAIAESMSDLLDQMDRSLRNPQNKPKMPKAEGDLSVRDLVPLLATQPKEPPLQRQRKTTAELVTIIDMALGAGDVKLFKEAMGILKEVNPSAYQAIICLKGTSAALLEVDRLLGEHAPAESKKDPAAPSVSQMLQGIRPREDVTGPLTGTVYFEKASPMEAANPLVREIVKATLAALVVTDVYQNAKAEIKGGAKRAADDLVKDRRQDLNTATTDLAKAKKEGDAENAVEQLAKVKSQEEKVKEAEDLKARMDLKDDEPNHCSLPSALYEIWLMRRSDSQDAKQAQAIKEMEDKKEAKAPEAGTGVGQDEGKSQPPAGPEKKPGLTPAAGAGGKHGETPEPFSGPAASDATSWFNLLVVGPPKGEMLTIFDVPQFKDFSKRLVFGAVDRLIARREKQLLQVKYDETKWQAMLVDKTRVIDLNDPRVSELPGEVPSLNDCFAADPIQEAAEGPVLGF